MKTAHPGTPAMTDTPPEFAEDARSCAGDSGRREAGAADSWKLAWSFTSGRK